jgi:hypothetical protein
MTNSEAYRILTREWTNMHHTERTALDNDKVLYNDVMALVKRGMREEATEQVVTLITDAGQAWRAKQDKRFINN